MSNNATKEDLQHATYVDTSDLAAKKRFYCFESWSSQTIYFNSKLVSFPTSLNNLKTNVDDLDVGKLKTVPVDLKK